MGFISRKLFPACGSMCVCCPALRSRSRQPVKRYKKLVAGIFPKHPEGQLNERKLVKLCEYAAKNPIRIPKITKQLEERFFRELRYGHVNIVCIVLETYNKLLCMCEKQMTYFASSLLLLTDGALDRSKEVSIQIAGCQTLIKFIYCQTDVTYARGIGSSVDKVCRLARERGEDDQNRSMKVSGLQCLAAMVWFMAQFSHFFQNLDEIVQVILENYKGDERNDEREEPRHQWLNEIVRSEGGCSVAGVSSSFCTSVRLPPEKKNASLLTKEEFENPRVWAQICLQRLAELARESTSMRPVLEPMLTYFDIEHHWSTQQGLAVTVLCDLCYFMEASGHQQIILNGIIRHLDHKNIAHDPAVKSWIVQVAANVARQIRSGATLSDIGCVSDLLRHLRKSLQSTAGQIGEEEINLNIHLQNSIESCLLEIAKGTKDADSLFYLMVIALEKLPPAGVVARATMGSVLILAHASVAVHSHLQLAFPEALLIQILKAMLHTDTEARVVAHQIFSVLLFPSSWRSYEKRRFQSNRRSALASVAELLDKLRKEIDYGGEKNGDSGLEESSRGKEITDDESKVGWNRRTSPNFSKLSSIIDRTTGTNFYEESCIMKLTEDQLLQLLSGFWIQANLSDNLPSNFEAIAHSYCLMLISSHIKNTNHNVIVRFFQLPLSLRKVSLQSDCGMLPPACQRSMFVTSTSMLMFAGRMYHMPQLSDALRSQVSSDVDPYLGINDDLQVYVKPQEDIGHFGSAKDNQAAILFLSEIREKNLGHDKVMLDIIMRHLCCIIKIDEEELLNQLSTTFSPDEAFIFAPKELRELDQFQVIRHLKESPSMDGELSLSSIVEDDVTSALSGLNISGRKAPHSSSDSHIMSIGQLLESALEVAGQVVGTSVSTSPLSYSIMAGQCEALEVGTRKKLSNWLSQENDVFAFPSDGSVINSVGSHTDGLRGETGPHEQFSTLKLPPASPFDNFIHAVSGPRPMLTGLSP